MHQLVGLANFFHPVLQLLSPLRSKFLSSSNFHSSLCCFISPRQWRVRIYICVYITMFIHTSYFFSSFHKFCRSFCRGVPHDTVSKRKKMSKLDAMTSWPPMYESWLRPWIPPSTIRIIFIFFWSNWENYNRMGLCSRLGTPFSHGFPTRNMHPGLKGPPCSPWYKIGIKGAL